MPGPGALVSLLKSRRYSTTVSLLYTFQGPPFPPPAAVGLLCFTFCTHARDVHDPLSPPPPSTSAITLYVCVSCIQ